MDAPAFVADEMLGRLARQLRMVGCDTIYVRGRSDDEIASLAIAEGRTLVTRDRALARRVPGAVLLTAVGLGEQFRELRRAFPGLPLDVAFTRCTLCNGALHRVVGPSPEGLSFRAPHDRPLYACARCGHEYWEGSHTAHVRARLSRWAKEPAP